MVKNHQSESVFNFSWDQVARAFWNRYPNPHSTHVLTEDVVSRNIVNGKLVTKKLITKTNKIPNWGERILGRGPKSNGVFMIEESVLDPRSKSLVTYTRNITHSSIMVVIEKATYLAQSVSSTFIQRNLHAESMLRLYGLSRPLEAFAAERYKKNVKSTNKGLEYVLEKFFIPACQNDVAPSSKKQLQETAKKAKEIATRAGQSVATYTGKTAA